jgi:hypothetical protein
MTHQTRLITEAEELQAARALVTRRYAAQGYATDGAFDAYLENPATTTFGLFEGDILCGTISLVPDGQQGLPMDSVYREELAPLRAKGKRLAEVVQFAVDDERHTGLSALAGSLVAIPLFGDVLSRAIEQHIDTLCISINPKHDRFYAMLGFREIGALKQYGAVEAPAIGRVLDVSNWRENIADTFIGQEILRHVRT